MKTRLRYSIYKTIFDLIMDETWNVWVKQGDRVPCKLKCKSTIWHHEFCADPFLYNHMGSVYIFYETLKEGKGVIGCFQYCKGFWIDKGVVLERPWHLSYPQVFAENGHVYMIPEQSNHGKGDVSLYEAVDFPAKWEWRCRLIDKPFADSTLFSKDGAYYLACTRLQNNPGSELWFADSLMGKWMRHPCSCAMSQSRRLRRCAGAFLEEDSCAGRCKDKKIYRMAQDCNGGYGKRVFRIPIVRMSKTEYEEGAPILAMDKTMIPSGHGVHTINSKMIDNEKWLVFDTSTFVRKPLREIIVGILSRIIQYVCNRLHKIN